VAHDLRVRPGRTDSREVAELRRLRTAHPELAAAADMQIEVIELTRRIQGRLTTRVSTLPTADVQARLNAGERLIDPDEVPVDTPDVRLMFRQLADVLRRYDMVEAGDYDLLQHLARDGTRFEAVARDYYRRTDHGAGPALDTTEGDGLPPLAEQVLSLALRPFLARSAEVWATRADLSLWGRASCPYCGGEPDLGVLSSDGERLLICSRCVAQWPFAQHQCPFCGNSGAGALTSFASRDRWYRVDGCNRCRKYLKSVDVRAAGRPALPAVDTIATLPLDAAAIQQGYEG
jgi:FdhE protein